MLAAWLIIGWYSPGKGAAAWKTNATGAFLPKSSRSTEQPTGGNRYRNALDAGERHEWDLLGVSDAPADESVILFWDTSRPSFGRTSRR